MRRTTLACLLILAAPAAAAPLYDDPPDPAASAAAEATFAQSVAEARAAGSHTEVSGWPVDLDGDGVDEIVGQIGGIFLCGNYGCGFVLRADGRGGYETLFHAPGMDALEVLDGRTGGWRDIGFWSPDVMGGPGVLRWNGTAYEAH